MSIKVLQISDLHVGEARKDDEYTTLTNLNDLALAIAMAVKGQEVQLILFTGDIVDANVDPAEYDARSAEAVQFFERLLEELNQNQADAIGKCDILFVPGNHELQRDQPPAKYFARYKGFLEDFYRSEGGIPDFYDQKTFSVFRRYADERIVFAGFNSADVSHHNVNGKTEAAYCGKISLEQLSSQRRKLEAIPDIADYNVVAFLHHHFYLVEERMKSYVDDSYLCNSDAFLEHLNRYQLRLIIHGHKHDNCNQRINIVRTIAQPDKLATAIGCGALNKADSGANYFNYFEVYGLSDSRELAYQEYKFQNSVFKLVGAPVVLPLRSDYVVKRKLLEILEDEPALYDAYTHFKVVDTQTPADEIIGILDKTVGTLATTLGKLYERKRSIFYLLCTVHYRANYHRDSAFLQGVTGLLEQFFEEDFQPDKREGYLAMLGAESLYEANNRFNELLKESNNQEKSCVIFSAIGFFIAELYLTLKNRPVEFFQERVRRKSDLEFDSHTLQTSIEGNAIVIEADEDRRALGISVVCRDAAAHKLVALVLKEFELMLNLYEESFSEMGFKMYYIIPRISKVSDNCQAQLESYNFTAYIKTLIPLLAGENLYSQSEVFARELIQNSIDSINMRLVQDQEWSRTAKGKINIVIRKGPDGGNVFEISDNGTGMNKYLLERYLTTIGRSFYKSDDYDSIKKTYGTTYSPISKFGIGFLSCFMVGERVKVHTRYYKDENGGVASHYLDIPNFDGCFFIEEQRYAEGADAPPVGTKIELFENQKTAKFDADKIVAYIQDKIINVDFPVEITNLVEGDSGQKPVKIAGHAFVSNVIKSTRKNKLVFFIPFGETEMLGEPVDIERYQTDGNYRKSHPHGILLYKKDSQLLKMGSLKLAVAGIALRESSQTDVFLDILGGYFDVFINFSSKEVDLDVSRENIEDSSSGLQMVHNEKMRRRLLAHVEAAFGEYLQTNEQLARHLPYFILAHLDRRYSLAQVVPTVSEGSIQLRFLEEPTLAGCCALPIEMANCMVGKTLFTHADDSPLLYEKMAGILTGSYHLQYTACLQYLDQWKLDLSEKRSIEEMIHHVTMALKIRRKRGSRENSEMHQSLTYVANYFFAALRERGGQEEALYRVLHRYMSERVYINHTRIARDIVPSVSRAMKLVNYWFKAKERSGRAANATEEIVREREALFFCDLLITSYIYFKSDPSHLDRELYLESFFLALFLSNAVLSLVGSWLHTKEELLAGVEIGTIGFLEQMIDEWQKKKLRG